MLRTRTTDDGERWVLLAVARDDHTADEWAAALAAAGLDAEVRIGEAAQLTGRSSYVLGVNSAPDYLFAFPVFVPESQREQAAAALIDAGWDGRHGQREASRDTRLPLRGALLAVIVSAAVVAALVLRGG